MEVWMGVKGKKSASGSEPLLKNNHKKLVGCDQNLELQRSDQIALHFIQEQVLPGNSRAVNQQVSLSQFFKYKG
jgi:hypothetical protein